MWFFSPPLSVQFLMYIDSVGSGSPMDMETDGPVLDDVNMLKKAVEEEATQVKSPIPHTRLSDEGAVTGTNTLDFVCRRTKLIKTIIL